MSMSYEVIKLYIALALVTVVRDTSICRLPAESYYKINCKGLAKLIHHFTAVVIPIKTNIHTAELYFLGYFQT